MSIRTLDIAEAVEPLAEYAEEVNTGPIVLMADGQPVAVVMSIKGIDLETISLSTNPTFLALIEHSRDRQKSEGGISSDEMRQRLGIVEKSP